MSDPGVSPPGTDQAHTCSVVPAGKVISYYELKALLGKSPDLLLVDVRTQEEVDKGKIPGSIHIPVGAVERELALDPAAFQDKYGVQKPPPDAPQLVFHCQMGRRGATATETARALGFEKARNYAGGYKEWAEKERC
ncbi:thiosulfate:glutathione sulfurtransferase-like isoform X1 [Lepisosteus oculatus]|uniref:thiosulfate:glutathione sulfurtransferase-like isoform X1 n=1 Tax=Lepisosteus oculatus TaxID=7918 RepID=UPI0035F523C0